MRRLSAVVVALMLLAAGAACTKKSSDDKPSADAEPTRGGVLRVGVARIGSLDPAQARTVEQTLVADQLFDALTTADPATLEPRPALAERWQASPDQKVWDFFLRPGVLFANGRAVTSADVKYTLERVARPQTASPAVDLLQQVTGYAAFQAGTAGELAGVAAPAPEHVRISLDSPLSVLPSVLSSPAFGVVPREAVEAAPPAAPFSEQPVGSGPFQFNERRDDVVVLTPVAGRNVLVDRLELHQFDDVAASYRAFAAGDVEWSRVPPDEVARAGAQHGKAGFRPYLAELFFGFNLKNPKFADPRFREAVVRAVDRQAIAKAVYGGTVLPMDGLIARGVPGHAENACGEKCAHDVERSKALVAEAFGGGPPPEIFLDYDEDPTQSAVAKAVQAGLKEAGITATLRSKPLKDYQSFAVSGQQELFRLGWIGAYPSPDAFLPPLFQTGSPSNLTGFSSGTVDQAFGAARAEPDPAKQVALYQQAEKEILGALPVIPIAQFELHSVVRPGVRGLVVTTAGTFDASVVWLDRRG